MEPIALQIQTPQFDLGGTLSKVAQIQAAQAQLQHSQLASQLMQPQVAEAQARQGALSQFRQNPNDTGPIQGFPDIMEHVQRNQAFQRNQNTEQGARAAVDVLSAPPDQTVPVYQQKLNELKEKNVISSLQHATMSRETDPEKIRTMARGLIAQSKPEMMLPHPGVTNVSPWGTQEYGIYDPISQTTRSPQAQTGVPGAATGQESSLRSPGNARGEEFLKTVEANPQFGRAMADKIRNINLGLEAPPPSNPRPGSPGFIEDMLLHQAFPGFNAATWQARKREIDASTGAGRDAQMVANAGTAIGHLNIMRDLLPQLKNSNWGAESAREYVTGPANKLFTGSGEGSYAQAVAKWNQTAHLLAKELAKVTSGSGGTGEGEVAKLEAPFNAYRSHGELSGALDNAVGLMDSRLIEKNSRWNQTFGGGDQEMPSHRGWLSPEHQRVLNKIEGRTGENALIYSNPVGNPRYNRETAQRLDNGAKPGEKTDNGPLPQTPVAPPAGAQQLMGQIKSGAKSVTLPSGKVLSAQEYVDAFNQKYGAPK